MIYQQMRHPSIILTNISYIFNIWWHNNPAFRQNDQMGWIIEDLSCPFYIKGFLGNIPTEYKFKNKILSAVVPSTWIGAKEL